MAHAGQSMICRMRAAAAAADTIIAGALSSESLSGCKRSLPASLYRVPNAAPTTAREVCGRRRTNARPDRGPGRRGGRAPLLFRRAESANRPFHACQGSARHAEVPAIPSGPTGARHGARPRHTCSWPARCRVAGPHAARTPSLQTPEAPPGRGNGRERMGRAQKGVRDS